MSINLTLTLFSDNLWELVSNTTNNIWDDQIKTNDALDAMKPQWSAEGGCNPPSLHCDMTGVTSTGLTVTLLSHDLICRFCDPLKRDTYYIWHKFERQMKTRKQQAAELGGVWYLKKEWKEIDKNNVLSRVDWLKQLKQL